MKLTPKKSLGQNFLRSQKAVDDIVNSLESSDIKNVVEIGGGEGVVTGALLSKGYKVTVIELDSRAVEMIENKYFEEVKLGKLKVIKQDVLEVSLGEIFESEYLLVGNIPYYITGLILRHIFEQKHLPKVCTLMVQKEVAERVIAIDKKESILSMSIKYFGNPKLISVVKRGSFHPTPNVDSAIFTVNIFETNKSNDNILKEESFFLFMKLAFKHPRKFALSNIKKYLSEKDLKKIEVRNIYDNLKSKLNEKERAEDINIKTWKEIIN